MKALVLRQKHSWPEYTEVERPKTYEGQMEVSMYSAAMNHREVWQTKGLYPGFMVPAILGADGSGKIGNREVIINPSLNWGADERFQADNYIILGMHFGGTFAEYLSIDERLIFDKPAHLTMDQAAALPLAGLTAYRCLFVRCGLNKGEKVLISGIGGGVALMAFQLALAAGAQVFVTSGSDEKIEKAISMGAIAGINYRDEKWGRKFYKETGGADVIIDSAGGEGFGQLVEAVSRGGRIGVYGGTRGTIGQINPTTLFFKQASIHGSTMGSDRDFDEMLSFVSENKIIPVIDSVFSLSEGAGAFERMDKGDQFGKIIIKIRD